MMKQSFVKSLIARISRARISRRGAADEVKIIRWNEVDSLDRATTFIVDVRDPLVYQRGAIAGAVNIPARQLFKRLDELPADKLIIIYCYAGIESLTLCINLHKRGFEVGHLEGGYSEYYYHTEPDGD